MVGFLEVKEFTDKATQTEEECFDPDNYVAVYMRDIGSTVIENQLKTKVYSSKLIQLQRENLELKQQLLEWHGILGIYQESKLDNVDEETSLRISLHGSDISEDASYIDVDSSPLVFPGKTEDCSDLKPFSQFSSDSCIFPNRSPSYDLNNYQLAQPYQYYPAVGGTLPSFASFPTVRHTNPSLCSTTTHQPPFFPNGPPFLDPSLNFMEHYQWATNDLNNRRNGPTGSQTSSPTTRYGSYQFHPYKI